MRIFSRPCGALVVAAMLLLAVSVVCFRGQGGARSENQGPPVGYTSAEIPDPLPGEPSPPTKRTPENGGTVQPASRSATTTPHQHAAGENCAHCQGKNHGDTAGAPSVAFSAELWNHLQAEENGEVEIPLPRGRTILLEVLRRHHGPDGDVVTIEGRVSEGSGGRFLFHRETEPGQAGPMSGDIHLFESEISYRLEAVAGHPRLVELPIDEIVCRLPALAEETEITPEEIPAEHPTAIPIPAYQNGVIPLQSLPGATAVVYLDFDGEKGPFTGWGNFDAARFNLTTSQIRDVWQRVAEDFAPFRINVTTDLEVYLAAPKSSRQRCIITPTKDAAPSAGGVAYIGDFNRTADRVCWAFYGSGKNAAEVISHEVGHTLGLSHDGRVSPSEEYYGGHGSGDTAWAPIMGVGYSKNLSQWSKGEYTSANRTQDDIAIIAGNNNAGFRTDDAGDSIGTARVLEILSGGVVDDEGVISTATDVDVLAFTTTGGVANLAVNPVTLGPNLDILAELKDSGGNTIASSNPASSLNAILTAALEPGTYTLHVSGVGLGDPLATGYTDYASLGAYAITGSIAGAIEPQRLAVDENAPVGTAVGAIVPLNNHGSATIAFSLVSGNAGGGFLLDPATGQLAVAGPLDFEALSAGWDRPAVFELSVAISNLENPSLNETRRVVVRVNDVNEAPLALGGTTSIPSGALAGASVFTISATDPDRFDSVSYSIQSGDSEGWFAIDAAGKVTLTGKAPQGPASRTLVIRVADSRVPIQSTEVQLGVEIAPPSAGSPPSFGRVERVIYDGITGSAVTNLTSNAKYPLTPNRLSLLSELAAVAEGDDYGSVIRAKLFVPLTGAYTFWVAGDDAAQLFLNTSGDETAGSSIASVSGGVNPRQWTANPSQQSASFNLTAGQICYLEIRHKESTSFDHVAVAWQAQIGGETPIPRQVIPSANLAPAPLNYRPTIAGGTARISRDAYAGSTVATVTASDIDATQSVARAITAGNSSGIFGIDSASGRIFIANANTLRSSAASTHALTIQATDNATPPLSSTGTWTVTLIAAGQPAISGPVQEIWDGISGTSLSSLTSNGRWPDRPDRLRDLTSLDSGSDIGDSYGARIRAYVVPPASGSYTFHIAADDQAALFLSTSENPSGASQIASLASWVDEYEFTANASQISAPVNLVAGQRYFIEARVKEGGGGDHVSVGWTGPGISTITVPSGAAVQPFDTNLAPVFGASSWPMAVARTADPGTIVGQVGASVEPGETRTYALLDGDPDGAFHLDPLTGELRLMDGSKLSIQAVQSLLVGVQDNGRSYRFPPKAATSTVLVSLIGIPVNAPPQIELVRPGRPDPVIGDGHGLCLEVAADDDGLPLGGALTIEWSQVSGPSAVAFSNPAAEATEAIFGLPGIYVLRCTATDGEETNGIEVNVTVGAGFGNTAPLLALPSGLSFPMPDGNIGATWSDDGLPLGSLEIISAQSTGWRYRPGTSAASSPVTAWRQSGFIEDGTWLAGGLPIGYGESGLNTTITGMRNSYSSLYLRRNFQFPAGRVPESLRLDLLIDDGAIVWINGIEVARQNVAAGERSHNSFAASAPTDAVAGSYFIPDARSILQEGNNVIAMHVFNGTLTSSDLFASLVLTTDSLPAPATLEWSRVSGPGSMVFATPSEAATAFTATAPGRHRLRLSADDGVTRVFREVEVEMVAVVPPIETWRIERFGVKATILSVAGDAADPDGDGLPNLLEYAFGLDPKAADAAEKSPRLAQDNGLWYFHFRRDPAATDLSFAVEHGSSPAAPEPTWIPLQNAPELLGEEEGIGLWRIQVPGPPTEASAFFRLRVDRP